MTADDTSRKAALARIAIHDVFVNAGRSVAEANDLVDAVALPLVQERDAARAEALRVDEANTRMGLELTAARAELAALRERVMGLADDAAEKAKWQAEVLRAFGDRSGVYVGDEETIGGKR